MTIEHALKSRQLGSTGLTVFPLALGCMGMSEVYGSTNDADLVQAGYVRHIGLSEVGLDTIRRAQTSSTVRILGSS
jgi:aryl-alcohol dehydrogenase-like predicted oxidoreductase